MFGPSEYAQSPYFPLPSVGVVTTDSLRNRKASTRGSSTDSTDDDDDDDDDDDVISLQTTLYNINQMIQSSSLG